ncbi:MAG TPA: 16S rRNA (cytosine(967)-C(5))-methyltransferase RsmB, partial [Candidatus Acidoferrales bacterium]|nr:16S rRNA (cytosine(967)-C(5))-methyltransferase RsmB [Candidatus Acidoferrales bacterium]
MSISPARTIAFDALRRVEAEGAYASDILHTELGAGVKPEDAALSTEITLGVLRWRRLLDFLLERLLKKSVAKLDLPVALALRLGLYQLRFLQRIPARAAVNESVELVKRARKASAATLVNAVLRRAATEAKDPAEEFVPPSIPATERIAILHSHPTWLVERWLAQFGEPRTIALLEANNRAPRLTCSVHDATHRDEVLDELAKSGLRVEPGQLLKTAFAVSGGSPIRTAAFRRGAISIQDEASQAVPLLLAVQPGQRVLDLCAAPGGKTPPLVRAAGENGLVIAADRHAHRLRAMRAQFERLHLCATAPVQLVELDAQKPLPFLAKFDRILVDAPCSGTGTLARHPEIRWRLKPEQLAELHGLQVAILTSALATLAPGGRVVYSTCSLEPEENEDV